MPLARFHLYSQGVDVWVAPTLAMGDGWVATMRHLARENRMFVVGVNPVLHADQIPAGFPQRDRLFAPGYLERNGPWVEEGNTVVVAPDGSVIAGPVREREETLVVDLDLRAVAAERRYLDPVGHYNRPDVFRLHVDTSPRPAVVETPETPAPQEAPAPDSQRIKQPTDQ
jgi:nitrilase